jgi:hypothetical protein
LSINAKKLAETLQFGIIKTQSRVVEGNEVNPDHREENILEFGKWSINNNTAGSGEPTDQPPLIRNMNSFGMPIRDKNHAGQGGTDSHPNQG